MNDRVKKNFSLSSETVERIERLSKLTTRADSHIVDLAVAELWNKYEIVHRSTSTIAEAEAAHQAASAK